jgi:hypothetical protein
LRWHFLTSRYKESELQNERLRRNAGIPTKPSTSSLRILELLQTKNNPQSIHTQPNSIQPTGLGTSAARILTLLNKNQ